MSTESAVERTGTHQALVDVAGWSVSVEAWRFWMTILVMSLAGDHTGMWDIDSAFDGGVKIQDVTVLVSAIMALWSSRSKKVPPK